MFELNYHKRGADFRHTPHGSPQTIPIYGRNLRPYWGSSNNRYLLFSRGGECEAIEQICLALFAECSCKSSKKYPHNNLFI